MWITKKNSSMVSRRIVIALVGILCITMGITFFSRPVEALTTPWRIHRQDFNTGLLNGQQYWTSVNSAANVNNWIKFNSDTGTETATYDPGYPIDSYGDILNFDLHLGTTQNSSFFFNFVDSSGYVVGGVVFLNNELRFHNDGTSLVQTLTSGYYYNFRVLINKSSQTIAYSLEGQDWRTFKFYDVRASTVSKIVVTAPINWVVYLKHLQIEQSEFYYNQTKDNFNTQLFVALAGVVIFLICILIVLKLI
jgi:hypothetical protein